MIYEDEHYTPAEMRSLLGLNPKASFWAMTRKARLLDMKLFVAPDNRDCFVQFVDADVAVPF